MKIIASVDEITEPGMYHLEGTGLGVHITGKPTGYSLRYGPVSDRILWNYVLKSTNLVKTWKTLEGVKNYIKNKLVSRYS